MLRVPMVGTTLPHPVLARFSAARVLIKPAAAGHGPHRRRRRAGRAGEAGVKDAVTKSLGSRNPVNVVKATILVSRCCALEEALAQAEGRVRRAQPPMAKLRISWKKSAIGYGGDQKRTIQALGLRRLGQTVEHNDSRGYTWYDTQSAAPC